MNRLSHCAALLAMALLPATAWAADPGWGGNFAESFSPRWKAIQQELAASAPRLLALPAIPIDDQGGTGGFAGIHPKPSPGPGETYAVELLWENPASIDLVALVPARRYDAKGLDAQYGLPEEFSVDLIDIEGNVVRHLADEHATGNDAVRRGHPFVYQITPAATAQGLRITARSLRPDPEGDGIFVHAWAEAMAFHQDTNVAFHASVRTIGGEAPSAPWHWKPDFLTDGQTPLGFPEIPAAEHGNIGWISEGRLNANEPISLTIDLGKPFPIDSIRLLPAKRPTSDLPSGFGFPRRLTISTTDDPSLDSWTPATQRELPNPGHNPVIIPFPPLTARFVRIQTQELWKEFKEYPAFFALSEWEILSNSQNVAAGKGVQSTDGMMNIIATGGRIWSAAALTDGFGPDGKLLPVRQWMTLLHERYRLESHRHQLRMEMDRLASGWQRTIRLTTLFLILAGSFLIIALPIRYRLHAHRQLTHVRERIAGDLHDEVGSNLGSIQMIADLAECRSGPSDELKRIQRIAAETVSAVRDIVWLLRPSGDHRIGTVEHLRETCSIMLETLDWEFTANENAWQLELHEEMNRDLFLLFREALHNIMRHAKATSARLRAEHSDGLFRLTIADNGVGIEPDRLERPATLRALRQRAQALKATLDVHTQPGHGTRLTLTLPLPRKKIRRKD